MIDGITVDACIMHNFFPQLVVEKGEYFDLINFFLEEYKLIIDSENKIKQEWCERSNFIMAREWITDQLKINRINMVESSLKRDVERKIFNEYGLDKTERDIEYIKVANVTALKYILTEDMHFYDPKKKMANHKTKEKIKNKRNGRLQKYLKKELKITISSLRHLIMDGIVSNDFIVPDYPQD